MAKQASQPGSRRGGGAGAEGDARPAGKWPAGCVAVSRDGRVVLVGQTRGVIVAYDAATSHVADIFRVRPLSSPPLSPCAHARAHTHTSPTLSPTIAPTVWYIYHESRSACSRIRVAPYATVASRAASVTLRGLLTRQPLRNPC